MATDIISRRPLRSRDTSWARSAAGLLARSGVSPNAISCASVIFAALGAAALFFSERLTGVERSAALALAIAGIQLRLVCNLLDGMVAVEGGRKTKSGEIFNDLPDRVADTLLFIAAGYAAGAHPFGIELGFLAALLAIFTAYMRTLGGACGLPQNYTGPMAKQQRMALLSIAAFSSIYERHFAAQGTVLWLAVMVINLGCLVTIVRRTRLIIFTLEAR